MNSRRLLGIACEGARASPDAEKVAEDPGKGYSEGRLNWLKARDGEGGGVRKRKNLSSLPGRRFGLPSVEMKLEAKRKAHVERLHSARKKCLQHSGQTMELG